MERMLSRFDLPRVDSPFIYVQPYWVCDMVGVIFHPRFPLRSVVAFVDALNSRAGLFEGESETLDDIVPAGVKINRINLVPARCNDPGGGVYIYSAKSNVYWPCRIPCDSTV